MYPVPKIKPAGGIKLTGRNKAIAIGVKWIRSNFEYCISENKITRLKKKKEIGITNKKKTIRFKI